MALTIHQVLGIGAVNIASFGDEAVLSADDNGLKKTLSQKINLILKEGLVKIYFRMEA
jgi:hypothetical protein